MGFNKKYVCENIKELKEQYVKLGHDEFRLLYSKYDAYFYSSTENMIFLQYVVFDDKKYRRFVYEFLRFIKIIK